MEKTSTPEAFVYKAIGETRKERLILIRDERFGGSNNELAAAIGKLPGDISRALNRGSFSDKLAREIEVKLGLDENILDQPIYPKAVQDIIDQARQLISIGLNITG